MLLIILFAINKSYCNLYLAKNVFLILTKENDLCFCFTACFHEIKRCKVLNYLPNVDSYYLDKSRLLCFKLISKQKLHFYFPVGK